MKLKGTKTCENLMKSFVNESQASIRYGYYASQAKKMVMYKYKTSF